MDDTDETTDRGPAREFDPAADHAFPDERVIEVLAAIDEDAEIAAYLSAQNVNPVDRLGYNDHGTHHVGIVRGRALQLYELLKRGGVAFDAADQGLAEADEAVIVALAATLHDIGHVVHRHDHPYYSIPLAAGVLRRFLDQFEWYDVGDRVRITGEVLHAILCHHAEEEPLTREAGVVRVADALDMERGRSRIPYERGGRGIDTISSRAIRQVSLRPGNGQPVEIAIEMTDASGVYQVDSLLKKKLRNSLIREQVRIVAVNVGENDELVEHIEL